MTLSEAGKWDEAATAFAESADAQPNATCFLNLAVARYQTKRPTLGLEALDRLAQLPDVPDDARARAAAIRSKLEAQVGLVTVSVSPASAELFVDGHRIAGNTPERALRLDPGAHSFALAAPGYASVMRGVDVAPGALRLVLALAPTPQLEAPAPVLPVAEKAPEGTSVLKSPWLWGGVGVVVVGVVTAALIASSHGGTASPNGGSERIVLSP